MTFRAITALVASLLLVSTGVTQSEPGWWAVSTSYQHDIYGPGPSWLTYFYEQPMSVTSDGSGGFFEVGFHSPAYGIYQVDQIPNTLTWQYMLLAPLNPNNWDVVAVDRKHVWLLGNDGDLKFVRKGTPNQTPNIVVNVASLGIVSTAVPPRYPVLQCSNGRDIVISIFNTGTEPAHIYSVDVEANPFRVRQIVRWTSLASLPTAVRVGMDGKLLLMEYPNIYEWSPATGALVALPIQWPPTSAGLYHTTHFDYDAWEDRIAAADGVWAFPGVFQNRLSASQGWSLMYMNSNAIVEGVTSLAPRPFEAFGIGCRNATGQEPRMSWQGLPRQGQSFSVTLRDAEPNGFAFFWLGLSDTYWSGFGPLPFDAGPLGAPGCMLRVAADIPFPVPVDANGRASLQQSVPINPALAGLQVFAQTASSSTANAFGFSASDALVIRVR